MSDSDSDDEQVPFGTPLEPIEEDEIPSKRKYQEAPDQFAVDDHGRRRFHGAFTGGFSAGFGNTVGTPEGWTPSTFKSSRSDKAKFSTQRPEDFMDDEDRGEFGIAPRQMQTQGEFSGRKRQMQRYHDGPIPGEPVLEQLLKAVHETAAVKMLRAMGWKPGQGTGDRVSREEKKRAKEQHKVYGCYMPPEIKQNTEQPSDSDTDSDYDFEQLFAPDDYEPYILRRKDDRFGLGYSGLSRHLVLGGLSGRAVEGPSHLLIKEKGKKVSIRGQAFGVGALEADDDDIYAAEDMSHYDFTMGGPEATQKKAPKAKGGPNVLEGFVKSTKPLPAVPSYPPPALPRDYTPVAAGARRSRFEPTTATPRDQGLGRHELTADARGALLGETPVPKLPDSTQTPPKPNPNELIATVAGRNVNFVSNTEMETEESFISIKDSGKEVAKTFRPFLSDPSKQGRYERYLRDGCAPARDGDMDALSEWERNRELVEFEQAAKLYKPLSGVMGDRFTHAAEPDEALNPLCVVAKSSNNHGLATADQIAAAQRGVYGLMTRTEARWRPESLVCKRFNVPDPVGPRSEAKTEEKPKVSYSIFSYMESSMHDKDSFTKEQSTFCGSKSLANVPKPAATENKLSTASNKDENTLTVPGPSTSTENSGFSKRMTVAELFMKESEKDQKSNETVTDTIDKFDKMDLYKSIFLSDSENEDDAKPETNNDGADANDFVDKPQNVERNLSPPRGIFANIDFDEINSWRRKADNAKTKDETTKEVKPTQNIEEKKTNETLEMAADVYGPRIPDNLQKKFEEPKKDDFRPIFRSRSEKDNDVQVIDSSDSSNSWVDLEKVKKKHKKKSKKHKSKHKKDKHKKKHKHKDK